MTTDPDAAIAFYRKIVGWGLLPWDQDPSYRMFTAAGTPVGAVMTLPEQAREAGAPPHWLFYVAVPDADAAVRQAKSLGGSAYVEMEIPSVGRFAVLADPQGAVFAVIQPSEDSSDHDGAKALGEFSWNELATTDSKAAWEFYRAMFGWDEAGSMDMGPGGTYQMFGREGLPLGGIYDKPPEMPAPPHWLCYALVANADRAANAVTRHGGKILNGPMDVPGGDRIVQCMDPQGAVFALHSMAPVAKPAPAPKPKARTAAKPKRSKAGAGTKSRVAKKEASARRAPARKPVKKAAGRAKTVTRRPVKKRAPAKRPVKKAAKRA
jgi:predicted enzyme related to lactoylglutathione lyase